jgi:hypothetical protein
VEIVGGDDAQRLNLYLSFLFYPPTTFQSVVPLTDQLPLPDLDENLLLLVSS